MYGVHGNNFIKTILRLASSKTEMNVVSDQVGAPTAASFIADVSTVLAKRVVNGEKSLCGTYHLVPNGVTNWCDFARWIIGLAGKKKSLLLKPEAIRAIPSSGYPTPAIRPLNSRMSNRKLLKTLGDNCVYSWEYYAEQVVNTLTSK